LNSSLPFGKAALKFCLPWTPELFFLILLEDNLLQLPIGQMRMKFFCPAGKFVAVWDDRIAIFQALSYLNFIYQHFPKT